MISDIFKIRDVPPNSTGVLWSVTWPGSGVILKTDNIKLIWDTAWDSAGCDLVGFALANGETLTIHYNKDLDRPDYAVSIFGIIDECGGLDGLGFSKQEQALSFVEEMEKHIAWRSLMRDYQ